MRRVLSHVRRGAAVFTAEREPLQKPEQNQYDGSSDSDLRIPGQDPDDERREAHDQDRDEKSVFAPDQVAHSAEHERAERPDGEPRGEREQREDESRRRIRCREELLADDRRQRSVQIEIVPLEDGAERRREDDGASLGRGQDAGGCHYRRICGWLGRLGYWLSAFARLGSWLSAHGPGSPLSVSARGFRSRLPALGFRLGLRLTA